MQDLLEQVAGREKSGCGSAQSGTCQSLAEKNAQVVLMPGAREVLALGRPSRDSTVCHILIMGDNAA